MTWNWPLWAGPAQMPEDPGRFGAVRKHDIHTGVDLYTRLGMPVVTVEEGTVVGIEKFTGPEAGSPWWHDTEAVLVEGLSGVVVYGEIGPLRHIEVGMELERCACVGAVKTVLRKDKGRPMNMLHFELYEHGARETVWWRLGEPRPPGLLDPTERLVEAMGQYKKGLC